MTPTPTIAEPVHCGFTVQIDTGENVSPWLFDGMRARADRDKRPLIVPVAFSVMGRHPNSMGDYSVKGLVGQVGIERKSRDDCISTVLGWQTGSESERELEGRRERFKRELLNLACMECGVVIVEATWEDCMLAMPGWDGEDHFNPATGEINPVRGKKSCAENATIFEMSVLSWQQRFKGCHWIFRKTRQQAEKIAFRYLEKFVEHRMEDMDRQERKAFRKQLREA